MIGVQYAAANADNRLPFDRLREAVQPGPWLSHMLTAAGLTLFALWVDHAMRFESGETRRVAMIELALAIYGTTCGIVSRVRGVLKEREKAAVACCLVLFAISASVALGPRLNR